MAMSSLARKRGFSTTHHRQADGSVEARTILRSLTDKFVVSDGIDNIRAKDRMSTVEVIKI